MKDSVEKWFKDGAKDLNVIPPHEAWEKVEKTLEDWPKHWYQSNFAEMNNDADTSSWNELSQQLEVRRNARKGYRNFVVRTASIAAALVLLPLWLANVVPADLIDNYVSSTTNAEATVNNEQNVGVDASANNNGAFEFIPFDFTVPMVDPGNSMGFYSIDNHPFVFDDRDYLATQDAHYRMTPKSLVALPITTQSIMIASSITSQKKKRRSEQKNQDRASNGKWFLGPTAILGSSSLLNPLSYRDDVRTGKSFNIAYGISGARRFNRNVFTADLLFNDVKSQSASLNSEKLNTELNGITLALEYKRVLPIFKNSEKLRPELYFGVGAFSSYVTKSSVMSNLNDSHYSSFTYRDFDFGGVVTAGASLQVSEKIRFDMGARLQSGAINLFEGRAKVPSQYFRTQSLFMGIQTKLVYAL
ncbi:MAG: hypothetical protein Crog4KO_25230 [Crocinitomicaceae bacterium]